MMKIIEFGEVHFGTGPLPGRRILVSDTEGDDRKIIRSYVFASKWHIGLIY